MPRLLATALRPAALALLLLACTPAEPPAGVTEASASKGASGSPPAPPVEPPPRGLWVLAEGSQRVLEHPEHLEPLLDDALALGVTDLFVQVYRGGRAWFASSLAGAEPYAAARRAYGGRDPLRTLVAAAHARGLRVHAWVNVLSLAAHPDARIVQDLGPSAVLVDQKGRSILDYPDFELPAPDREWYRMGTPAVWLDPAAPGVAERLVATFAELLQLHPELDGLHLDYVRYADVLPFTPGTRFGVGLSFGFGEASRARFRAETGRVAPFGDSLAHGDRFDAWRREKLGELVAGIARSTRAERPGLRVSAAVIADRERAYLVDFQDWAGWLDAGWLDFAVPMLYTRDTQLVRHGVEALAGLARRRELWVGLGSWLFAGEPAEAARQLALVDAEPSLGSALFSWDSIRETPALRAGLVEAEARRGPLGSP